MTAGNMEQLENWRYGAGTKSNDPKAHMKFSLPKSSGTNQSRRFPARSVKRAKVFGAYQSKTESLGRGLLWFTKGTKPARAGAISNFGMSSKRAETDAGNCGTKAGGTTGREILGKQ